MITDYDEYIDALFSLISARPTKIFISTFGIYTGVTSSGTFRPNQLSKVMDAIKGIDTRILVGYAPYYPCNGGKCLACERKYASLMLRLYSHCVKYRFAKWRVSSSVHLKAFVAVCKDGVRAVLGGRNFTGSDWADVSFVMDDATEIVKLFIDLWNRAEQPDRIGAILKEQGISEEAIELI